MSSYLSHSLCTGAVGLGVLMTELEGRYSPLQRAMIFPISSNTNTISFVDPESCFATSLLLTSKSFFTWFSPLGIPKKTILSASNSNDHLLTSEGNVKSNFLPPSVKLF